MEPVWSKIRPTGRHHAAINSTKRSKLVKPVSELAAGSGPSSGDAKDPLQMRSVHCATLSNSAAIQEPLAPTFDRRTTDFSPRVVKSSSEISEDRRFLRMQDEVGDPSWQRRQERERSEAEFLRDWLRT